MFFSVPCLLTFVFVHILFFHVLCFSACVFPCFIILLYFYSSFFRSEDTEGMILEANSSPESDLQFIPVFPFRFAVHSFFAQVIPFVIELFPFYERDLDFA